LVVLWSNRKGFRAQYVGATHAKTGTRHEKHYEPGGETAEEIEFRTHRKGFHLPIRWAKHMEKQASAIIQDDDPASEADEGI
jgi:hypothetical protein